jgi:hypothetical protein
MKKINIKNRFLKYPVSIAALIITAIFVLSLYDSFDINGLWRYLIGRDILERGVIFDNPYTWINGTEWSQSEWMFDLLYYFSVKTFGMAGYVILLIIPLAAIWTIGYLQRKNEISAFLYSVFFMVVFISFPKDTASSPTFGSAILLPVLIIGYLKFDSIIKKLILSFVSGIVLSNFDLSEAVIVEFFLILCFIIDQAFDLYNKKFDLKTCLKSLGIPFVYLTGTLVNPAGINVLKEGYALVFYYFDRHSYTPEKLIPSIVVVLVIMTCGYSVFSENKKVDCIVFIEISAAVVLSFVSSKVGLSAIYLTVVFLPGYFYRMISKILNDITDIEFEYHPGNQLTLAGILIGMFISLIVSIAAFPSDYDSYVHEEQKKVISDEMMECLKGANPLYLLHGDEVANYLMWNGVKVMYDTRDTNYYTGLKDGVNLIGIINTMEQGLVEKDAFDQMFEFYNAVLIDPSCEKSEWFFKYNSNFQYVMTDECGNSLYIIRGN